MSSCLNPLVDVQIDKDGSAISFGGSGSSLSFATSSISVMAGDDIIITSSNGTIPYSATTINYGSFNAGTSTYSAPSSQGPVNHVISLDDFLGVSGDLTVNILGFGEEALVDFEMGASWQNYPMSLVQTTDGSIYLSAIFGDGGLGWEGAAIYKSIDNGASWSRSDTYFMYIEGESHSLQLAAKDNDVYSCGYTFGSVTWNTEWYIRKTSNGGNSWSTIDHYMPISGDISCSAIAVAPSGDIVAAGNDENDDVYIRTSNDDGVTWTTIEQLSGIGELYDMKISPSGDIWLLVSDKIYVGSFSGSWSWSGPHQISALTFSWVAYQKRGKIELVSDSEAYYVGRVGGKWQIFKTTDGGVSWTGVYDYGATSEGVDVIVLSTGEIISSGNNATSTHNHMVEKSIDNGLSWTQTLNVGGTTSAKYEGNYSFELQNGDVLTISSDYNTDGMKIYKSFDKGDSWNLTSHIYYSSYTYSSLDDYAEDASGNMYAVSYIAPQGDADPTSPFAISKSADNGNTWTTIGYERTPGAHLWCSELEITNLGHLFAIKKKDVKEIRYSIDNGVSWSNIAASNSVNELHHLRAVSSGELYYLENEVLKKVSADGLTVTDVYTFAIASGQSSLEAKLRLEVMSDDTLVVNVRYRDGGITETMSIFTSTDGGGTWNEKLKIASSTFAAPYLFTNGTSDIYYILSGKIYESKDRGNSWNEIYDGSLGSARHIVFSSDNQLFFSAGDNVITYSNVKASWFVVWSSAVAITPDYGSEIANLINCKLSSKRVCVVAVNYNKGLDSANYIWPLN
ncbi:hypothetical protein M900_0920 [Bacteriovorax sp. Seq25_V]|nr:hypothetical protein M900_0920 [Bacteriovorax sp. Seq25_V]